MGKVGDDKHPQPYLAFSHGDLLWGNDFPTSRFGQGAFQTAVRAVYEETSGRKLEATTFGKPEKLTYEYANELLKERVTELGGNAEDMSVWMIGDNPASDILGANRFGWSSALVRFLDHLSYLGLKLMLKYDFTGSHRCLSARDWTTRPSAHDACTRRRGSSSKGAGKRMARKFVMNCITTINRHIIHHA